MNKNYRHGVGAVIINADGQIALFKRRVEGGWQFPEGGIEKGEEALDALRRELYEETGLSHYQLKKESSEYSYKIPANMLPERLKRSNIIGQKKKFFLISMNHDKFNLNATNHPEFIDFRFFSPQECVSLVIEFKRDMYKSVLQEFGLLTEC